MEFLSLKKKKKSLLMTITHFRIVVFFLLFFLGSLYIFETAALPIMSAAKFCSPSPPSPSLPPPTLSPSLCPSSALSALG